MHKGGITESQQELGAMVREFAWDMENPGSNLSLVQKLKRLD